jgi:septal ring factor EnvC (AmiA/AmiB activator)
VDDAPARAIAEPAAGWDGRGVSRLLTGLALALALALALVACGGDAAEDRAQSKVCDARADIQKQVDELSSMTLSSASLDSVQQNLEAIKKDVEQISGQQSKLADDRKQEVQKANQAFKTQVEDVGRALVSGLASGGGEQQIKAALQDLASSYKAAFAPVNCD